MRGEAAPPYIAATEQRGTEPTVLCNCGSVDGWKVVLAVLVMRQLREDSRAVFGA